MLGMHSMINKPVILLGNGARVNPALVEYLCGLGVPILTTWMAADLVPEDSPVFCGRPGIYGQRAANIIQQKATQLYCFGARLDEQQVAYRYDNFAPSARKRIYEVDQAELDKLPDTWLAKYQMNLNEWKSGDFPVFYSGDNEWLDWCKSLYARFRPELDGMDNPDYVDPFHFIAALSDYAQPDDIIVSGDGKAGETFLQAFKVKQGQRLIQLSTNGAMGYDIPVAIGAAIASGRRVLCVTGDGSFMLNVQELEVVRRLKLPIQFFIYSNNGYGSIRAMQRARFDGRVVGADPASGLTLPKLATIANCYEMEYQFIYRISSYYPMRIMGQLIELHIDPDYIQVPRVATSFVDGKWMQDSMERMTPYLPEDELKAIMDA